MENLNDSQAHATTAGSAAVYLKDTLGPLLTKPVLGTSTSLPGTSSRYRHTPPATPRTSPSSPSLSASEGPAENTSPHSVGKGIAAPASAVDDIAEKFGRPRARSLSRHDLSLSPWAEDEDGEGGAALPTSPPPRLKDRRRTVSMSSVAEEHRRSRPSNQRCLDCNLPPSFANEGEPPIFCRAHQMEGMVDVLREGCERRGCNKTASYGFPGEGRQRCFSHMESGMVHVLTAAARAAGEEAETKRPRSLC
eukprot:g9734.t2